MSVILKNTSYASVFFGADAPLQKMYMIPRVKYMFYANFVVAPEAYNMFPKLKNLSNWQGGVSFKIKTIDKPNVDLAQRELNQYNRKRYAYVKTEYKPVTVSIYDTVDNSPLNLWIEYFNYYFGDARLKSAMTMGTSPVDPTFDDATGWGLRPLSNQINFFKQLNIYALYNRQYTLTSYLNPKVSSVDFGNHDTSSNDLEDYRMTMSYETLQYSSGAITPGLAALFGLDASPYHEPTSVQNPTAGFDSQLVTGDAARPVENNRPVITSQISSVTSYSGISGSSYTSAIDQLQIVAGRPGVNQQLPNGQRVEPSAPGASDVVYTNPDLGSNPSNQPIPANYGLIGIPSGQLPNTNSYLPIYNEAEFIPVNNFGAYNLLGSFGSFNFGGLQVTVAVGASYQNGYNNPYYRENVSADEAFFRAQPITVRGQRLPNQRPGYHTPTNTRYGPQGPQYLTQYQQVQEARRRVQQGEVSLTVSIGNPTYDDYGEYTGYDQAPYQPAPNPVFGLSLAAAAAANHSTVTGFFYLDNPSVYGGDPDDNLPPPVVYPYDINDDLDTIME
jgi:hypothetical protein